MPAFTLIAAGAITTWVSQAAGPGPSVTTVFNSLSLVLLVLGILALPRYLKAKQLEARVAEKDEANQTHVQTIEALRERDRARDADVAYLRDKVNAAEQRLEEAKSDAGAWEARYSEQQKYTAGPAFEAMQSLLENSEFDSQRRHDELMAALGAITREIGGGQ